MPVGEKAHYEAFHEVMLADDDLAQLGEERANKSTSVLDGLVDGSDFSIHSIAKFTVPWTNPCGSAFNPGFGRGWRNPSQGR